MELSCLWQWIPHAFSFAKNKFISVKKAFGQNEITQLFNLPLSQVAYSQVLSIQQIMDSMDIDEHTKDV